MSNRALQLITTSTTPQGSKRESLTITYVDGSQAALTMLTNLQRDHRTGQCVLNLSQGRVTGLQWVEKQSLTKLPD